MNSQLSPLSFFSSKTLAGHLWRGVAAGALFTLAVKANDATPSLAAVAAIGGIVMLRSYPLCWTIGLYETIRVRFMEKPC